MPECNPDGSNQVSDYGKKNQFEEQEKGKVKSNIGLSQQASFGSKTKNSSLPM